MSKKLPICVNIEIYINQCRKLELSVRFCGQEFPLWFGFGPVAFVDTIS